MSLGGINIEYSKIAFIFFNLYMAGYFLAAPYFATDPQIWEMGEGLEILFLEAISLFLVVLFGISFGGEKSKKNFQVGVWSFLIIMTVLLIVLFLAVLNADQGVLGPFFSFFKPSVLSLLYLGSSTILKIWVFLNDRELNNSVFYIISIGLAFSVSILLLSISNFLTFLNPEPAIISFIGFIPFFGFFYYFILAVFSIAISAKIIEPKFPWALTYKTRLR